MSWERRGRRRIEASELTMASSKVSIKLLVDTNANRVLFAEASKDFIDFLFNLLRLPIGTVARLLSKETMVGSLGKLYESIENLSDDYLINPTQAKNMLLKQHSTPLVSAYLLPPTNDNVDESDSSSSSGASKLYMCSRTNSSGSRSLSFSSHAPCTYNVTYTPGTKCESCGNGMNFAVSIVGNNNININNDVDNNDKRGFVKGVVTYTVMDDLEVRPMSTISTLTLLSKFNVKDVASLQERVVPLGMDEGIKLLKVSLESKNVLTRVFLIKEEIS